MPRYVTVWTSSSYVSVPRVGQVWYQCNYYNSARMLMHMKNIKLKVKAKN